MKIAEAVAIKNLMRQPLFFCGYAVGTLPSFPQTFQVLDLFFLPPVS